ncbi:MAG: IS110 family transposase [Aestuariibacter sp.]|nr:IS110 family transposase [Aestuariibacter sp.]
MAVERIVYEPTGIYHRRFEDALAMEELPLAKVNPLQAHRFAEARGTRAMTDKVDAAVLAHMGVALQPGIVRLLRKYCAISRNYRLQGKP